MMGNGRLRPVAPHRFWKARTGAMSAGEEAVTASARIRIRNFDTLIGSQLD